MIPVSSDFLAALRGSHSAVYRARVLTTYQSGTDPVGTELQVVNGAVRLDATADERSALDITVTGDWPVNHQSSPLAPFGHEIYVERGIQSVSSSGTEWVGLGYFRIETLEQTDAPRSPIRATGRDRMAALIEARLLEPRTFPTGTTFKAIFQNLVLEIYPSAQLDISGDVATSTLREPATVDRERYDFLRDMATSRGQIMYFDYRGYLVVEAAPDPTVAVWTVNSGPNGVLINVRRQLSRAGVYNAVVAEGSEADIDAADPPARGVAVDDDPNSATYFYGPYGQVPRFYASPLLFTDAQAISAANSILLQTTGLPYSLDLSFIPNPALEPLDAIGVQMGSPGNLAGQIVVTTASGQNLPNEGVARAFDGNIDTKWLTFANTGWIAAQLDARQTVTSYALTSGDDVPARDPAAWQFQGSHDGITWTTLDTRTGQSFADRKMTKSYTVANPLAWEFYRLNITLNSGDVNTQLSELWLYAREGSYEIHVIDTVTIPLSSDASMSANTRATIEFSIT